MVFLSQIVEAFRFYFSNRGTNMKIYAKKAKNATRVLHFCKTRIAVGDKAKCRRLQVRGHRPFPFSGHTPRAPFFRSTFQNPRPNFRGRKADRCSPCRSSLHRPSMSLRNRRNDRKHGTQTARFQKPETYRCGFGSYKEIPALEERHTPRSRKRSMQKLPIAKKTLSHLPNNQQKA